MGGAVLDAMTMLPAIAAYSSWVGVAIGARLWLDHVIWVTDFRFAFRATTFHVSLADAILSISLVYTAGWIVTIFFGIELVGSRCAHADLSTVEVLTQ